MEPLKTLVIDTGSSPDAAVIWLHGLGANGHDFEPVIPHLGLPESAAVRFIFPHAPEMPVTINGGMRMPAWYDIKAIAIDRTVDTEQLVASATAVGDIIQSLREEGITDDRIVIAGFSQGGAVAYQLGLSWPEKLAGIFGLSTYFATADTIEIADANKQTPILICHGTQDPIVPEVLGKRSVEVMRQAGFKPEYETYPIEHSVCLEEIQKIGVFLRSALQLT